MLRAEFDKEKLQEYITLLHGIIDTSITVYDAALSPIIETDVAADPVARTENIRKRLADGKTAPAIWFAPDGTTEIASPIFYEQSLYAYLWIGNLYYKANANPHVKLKRKGRPVYDSRSIHNILDLAEGGVQLFLRDIYDVDPDLQDKLDQFIFDNLNKKITLRMLSTALNTDITIVRNFLTEELNCNLPDYLRKKKLEAAKQLLLDTDLSVAEISEKIGMTEEVFNRLFLKSESVPPEIYRKSNCK